jgi:SSS family solute:Na+ symporter
MFSTQTMAELYMVLASLIGSGVAGVFFLGIFTRGANTAGVCCALVADFLVVGYIMAGNWGLVPEHLRLPIHSYYAGTIGNITTVVVGVVASWCFSTTPKELRNLTVWTQDSQPVA